MQQGTSDTNVQGFQIILDAAFDLNSAGECACDDCCDAFSELFEDAADALAVELTEAEPGDGKIEIGVYREIYGSSEAHAIGYDPHDYWQRIHDRVSWTRDDVIEAHSDDREAVIAAIENAQSEWTECDWVHELRDEHGADVCERDEDGEVVKILMCEGSNEKCDYCRRATADAAEASAHGDEAIACLRRNDPEAACAALRYACALEVYWGDDPVWRPVLKACETYARLKRL